MGFCRIQIDERLRESEATLFTSLLGTFKLKTLL